MSDVADPDDLPRATSTRARWPGLVWAIPLSALILVLGLGLHAFLHRGVTAVIAFDTVSGVKIGDTKVVFQGYEVGRVIKVDVEHKTRRIDVTVKLDRRAKPVLRTGTLFWLVGVKPSLSDVSSVKGAISGPTIGLAPSFTGKPTRYFHGLTEEPAVLPGTPGTSYLLTTDYIGAIKRRSTIDYHGQPIGKVIATRLAGPADFRVKIFVYRPFDRLVRPGALFWQASPLQLSLGSGSVRAGVANPSALLDGAIDMDLPDGAPPTPSPAGSRFMLGASRADAEAGPPGPRVAYAMTFSGAGGTLAPGAPITLLGFRIGEVTARTMVFDGPGGLPATRVTASIEPARLSGVSSAPPLGAGSLRVMSDAAIGRLLAHGYRARLVQQPPLVGSEGIALVRGGGASALIPGNPPGIPAIGGSGDPGEQVQDILAKIDRVPFDRIGADVAATTARLRALVSSPRVENSLDHLHAALVNVDQITAQVKPEVGPLVAKLREAATQASAAAAAARAMLAGDGGSSDASLPNAIEEMTDAAGSIRALADYLGRHPEALIKGKGKGQKVRKARK